MGLLYDRGCSGGYEVLDCVRGTKKTMLQSSVAYTCISYTRSYDTGNESGIIVMKISFVQDCSPS